ncbi:MAG TPA: ankyrin repeat domain-containing protein [Flavobacteriaceae bacterium]|nr:ankyrin repeat domain-containing protein [Flavobacteriaceae bacterium]
MKILKILFLGLLCSYSLFASDCECKCECSDKKNINELVKIDVKLNTSKDKNMTKDSKEYILNNINFIDNAGNTLLHQAIINKDIKNLEEILKQDFNINHKNNRGQTPLHLATINNSLDIVKVLIRNNAKITLFDTYGYSALYYANYLKNFNISNYLKNYGASIEIRDSSKKTKLDAFISSFNNEGSK